MVKHGPVLLVFLKNLDHLVLILFLKKQENTYNIYTVFSKACRATDYFVFFFAVSYKLGFFVNMVSPELLIFVDLKTF